MDHSIAAKYAARPAARFVRPSTRVRERRLGLRPSGSFRAPGVRATVLHGPEVAPLARLRASWRAIQPAASRRQPQRPAAAAGGHGVGQLRAPRRGPPPGRRVGAVARLRTSTATSAGGIVVRYESGQPWLVVGSRRRERDGRTWTLPKGTPERRRDPRGDRPPRGRRGDRARGPDHRAARLDRVLVRPVAATRIHKTVHYFLMEPIGGDLAASRSRVRRGPLDPVRHARRRC